MSSLNPLPLTPFEMMPVGEYSAGPFTVANINSANYNQNPSMLPSNKILIRKGAYAGTKSNCAAAKGKFVPYKSMKGGNKNISRNDNMNGGMKLNAAPIKGGDLISNPRHHAGHRTYDPLKGGKKRRKHTQKKRKSMRKHKKHAKRHHKRSRRMHKKHSRKHKKHTRRHRRRSMKGGKVGGPQPFSNVPISFGYSANLSHLKPSMSAVANPVPFKAYEGCSKVSRS